MAKAGTGFHAWGFSPLRAAIAHIPISRRFKAVWNPHIMRSGSFDARYVFSTCKQQAARFTQILFSLRMEVQYILPCRV